MAKGKTAMKYYYDSLVQKGIKQGITQGRELGSFEMAIKIKHQFGLKTALEMSEFSAEELENEKLN